jgi:alpha-beta hydrolase superfamily lysophospholipase
MAYAELPVRELKIRASDGLRLHVRHWVAEGARAVVVVAHGFGEHGGCYDQVAGALVRAAGVDVLALDLRGHGESPGRRGVVQHYDELLGDLTTAIQCASRERPDLPCYLLGHSNGGLLAFLLALEPEIAPRIAGLIVSNPSIRLAVRVPEWKLSLARFLLRYAPRVTLSAYLRPEQLSRDPAMQRRRRDDPLIHSRISAPLYFGMVESGQLILSRAEAVHQPVLLIVGGADPVVSPVASRELFDRLGSADKTLLFFPPMRHEPFQEIGRESLLQDVADWLDVRLTVA